MKRYKLLLAVVCVINLLGTIAGFFYYQWQLERSPKIFWAFIPDSPGSTMLFAIAVALIFYGRKADFLSYLASASVIKYGFWTMFVIVFYNDYFLAPYHRQFYYLMFILHFGMVIEPVVLLHTIDYKRWYPLLAIFWLGLNDYVDYVLGYTSLLQLYLPDIGIVGRVTAASTIIISGGIYLTRGYKPVFDEIFARFEKA